MTLMEMSSLYASSASAIRLRISELRKAAQEQTDEAAIWELKRRIAELTPLLREARELAALTGNYYNRSYFRNERYTL